MEQYIPKATLLAEMEKEIKRIYAGRECVGISSNEENIVRGLQKAEDIIDTIEVKEVDLDEEIEKCLKQYHMIAVGKEEFEPIAKHFFEIGMHVSNKAQKGE